MERTQVESSNVISIGYDEASSTLEVEFKGGGIYQYFDVPSSVHQELMSDDSKGKFLSNHIKGKYRFSKV